MRREQIQRAVARWPFLASIMSGRYRDEQITIEKGDLSWDDARSTVPEDYDLGPNGDWRREEWYAVEGEHMTLLVPPPGRGIVHVYSERLGHYFAGHSVGDYHPALPAYEYLAQMAEEEWDRDPICVITVHSCEDHGAVRQPRPEFGDPDAIEVLSEEELQAENSI